MRTTLSFTVLNLTNLALAQCFEFQNRKFVCNMYFFAVNSFTSAQGQLLCSTGPLDLITPASEIVTIISRYIMIFIHLNQKNID